MKWIKQIYDCFHAYKQWFLILMATSLLFSYLAWLAYPETFKVLVGLMIVFTLAIVSLSVFLIMRKQKIIEVAFQDFLLEPNETNEERLCRVAPKTHWSIIRKMGSTLRSYQSELNDQVIELTDYENYIEGWVHEMKKPLSLMTLVLDNRSDEMSPLVRQRMLHIRDQMHGDVERILYFARLGAAHKDYIFEPINVLAFCKQTVEDHQTLLDESGFQVQFKGEEMEILSDRKGLAFILEQIIFNSTKYVAQNQNHPILEFETGYDRASDQSLLYIRDNGPGVSEEDLAFIFDKGFTGGRGTYTRQATGMGLFLVSKMAYDLAIQLDAKSELGSGLTIALKFPNVKR
ncbi:sensor histidine kinase [Virgibacillus pantothenticus]|uniref:histidine kinase n=1 Tax=Virgibacillus pantothenticus TaxID=1473 RepID=A0A0L0QVM4_VIRPA|nr:MULTISPECIES: sensor histidine kinase [Virgibacillus]API92522.1 ATP-binding protein [Virgibacillus sp. 6R]KNE22268.1 histidine kinase [Virgibacillus pantothenticus]MBS7427997.1 sensor histidine kinase [Virgibacillus sp. 19R1-5]MBU8568595.1 sensor histidine kinase [Virgibacillus pantothenticus]MBU8602578.1 sensor histidine kinase [Virgibacillus pantothenticus]